MTFRFTTPTPLRWVDLDAEGVVNNAVYLSLMEQARFAYFTRLGQQQGQQVPFVLAEARVGFRKPGRLGMEVTTAAAVVRLGTASFTMQFEVRGGAEVLAEGTAVLVFVDRSFRPTPMPAATRAAIAAFEGIQQQAG